MSLVRMSTEPLALFWRELTLRSDVTGSPVNFPPGLVPGFFMEVMLSSVTSSGQLMLPY